MPRRLAVTLASLIAFAPLPAMAEVAASGDSGFVSHHEVLIDATPAAVWAELVQPAKWWSPDHTYSGDSANLSLDLRAGGCFCEATPADLGQVEHMQVLRLSPNRLLRLSGGLGPLQSEAVEAVLTMTLITEDAKTRLVWDYVVGGYSRQPLAQLAPAVDQVIGEQLLRLAQRLGTTWDGVSPRL